MTVNYNPRIVTDGLVIYLDPANVKGYDEYENLFTYSEQFDNGAWISGYGQNAVVTPNQILSPDGTLTADLITFTTDATTQSRKEQIIGTQSGTLTVSIFIKKGTLDTIYLYVSTATAPTYPNVWYTFSTNNLVESNATGTSTLYSNGWVRLSATATIPSHNVYSGLLLSGSNGTTGTIYAWGAQVEKGSVVNDYYATTTTIKTRGSTLIDLTGNSYNATLQNGVFYDTRNNGYLIFDGANDYAELSSNPNTFTSYSQQITVEVWLYVNPSASFSNAIGIVSRGTAGDTYGLRFTGSVVGSNPIVSSYFSSTTTGDVCESVGNIPKGVWKQLNAVWTGSSSILYINGDLIQTSSSPVITGSVSTGTNYNIGREPFVTSYFNGNISAIKIYNKALTASEIRQNFNALRGRFDI